MRIKLSRFFIHSVRTALVLVIAGALFSGFLFWLLSKEPVDLGFARNAIEAALYDVETGNSVKLKKVVLYWPDYTGPLLLGLENAELLNKEGKTILSVDEAAMSFSRSALLVGRIRPKSIILKKPKLSAIRDLSGNIDIGFGDLSGQTENAPDTSGLMTRILGYLARPGHEAAKNSIISRLESFEIKDAQVSIEDKKYNATWKMPHFTAGFYSASDGLQANFDASMDDVNGKVSSATVILDYKWKSKKSLIKANFSNIDTKLMLGRVHDFDFLNKQDLVFSAHLDAQLGSDFIPESLSFNLNSENGSIYHPDLSEQPIGYTGLGASAIYDHASSTLIVDNTNITLGGVTLRAKADIKKSETGVTGPVKLEIYDVEQSKIGPLWPLALKGDNAEHWIVEKMSNGRFENVWLGFDFSLSDNSPEGWVMDTKNIQAGFSFKDMDLNYRPPLYPVLKANGSGTFDFAKDEMNIKIDSGYLGKLEIKDSTVYFDRLVEKDVGGVTIDANLSGSLQEALKYLAEEPIHANKKSNMNLEKVKGNVDAKIGLNFPTHKDVKLNEFKIAAEGKMKDFTLPAVVQELDLSGKSINFSVKDGEFSLIGDALVDQRDVKLDYREFIESENKDYKSKIKASLLVDPNIREKLGIDLSKFIEGSVGVNLTYTSKNDGTALADIDADLTPGRFFVDPLDFTKSPSVVGSAHFLAHFKDKKLQKITNLSGKGDGFEFKESEINFLQKDKETLLAGGRFSAFTIGDTKGKVDFEIGKDRVAKIVMKCTFLDARPFMDSEKPKGEYDELPMMISVSASSMRTADLEVVKAAEIYIDMDSKGRFNQIEMDAIAGASAVYLRYSPDATGKRTFRLKTDDAGAALRSFQVYSNIRGGKMVIYGEPVEGGMDRNLVGKAQITDFKAVKAPILTKLLSLISVPGLIEAMSSDGLNFSKLEADFNWVYRKEGSVLVLKDGRTSGNSLGLTFDGTFDNAQRTIDVNGTIIPMSEVNNLVGKIPLVGDILTGGSGGVFAATYSIKGSSENPDIGLNPLSVLTPGILRRILFE